MDTKTTPAVAADWKYELAPLTKLSLADVAAIRNFARYPRRNDGTAGESLASAAPMAVVAALRPAEQPKYCLAKLSELQDSDVLAIRSWICSRADRVQAGARPVDLQLPQPVKPAHGRAFRKGCE